ncbi:condensation domain-containing protein, partial [Streptomyces griseoluteus]|uniref:condensation domain-containing protein n=1 Tax=Streptomyces griseoluteus TaxID=29306 RepID=UPI0037F4577D
QLPEFMVPATVMTLDAFPLTVNRKLDRHALPAPEFTTAALSRAPRDSREETLCAIFGEILGLETVGIDDSFFDLGGHSLLATRVVSRIRTALGTEVPLRTLFEAPTVAQLAERMGGAEDARTRLVAGARPAEIPLSFAQRRLWFLNRLEGAAASTYNIPTVLRLTGDLDAGALETALRDVVVRHESLRTVFLENSVGEPYQLIHPGDEVTLRLPVRQVSERELDDVVAEFTSRGFELSDEAPLRACLLALEDDTSHILVLVLHHIAGDGWSMAPLARDIATAYEARVEGRAPDWEPLPVQYADYALWQRELLGEESNPDSVVSSQLAHWTKALSDLPEQLALPTDRARAAVASYRGDSVPVEIEAELHARIGAVAGESGASVFMVLQAAFAVLLSRLGAGEDIPIGSPVAGRTDEALDDLVGFFVNTLVLRTDVSGDPTFRELIGRVRETDLAAYAHQDVPFEHLVEVLNPARSMSRHPLFQVMLVMQNTEKAELNLPGLTLTGEPTRSTVAKFDLSLALRERYDAAGGAAGLTGVLEFASDLFDLSTAQQLTKRFGLLLASLVADPDQVIGGVEILSVGERRDLLSGWQGVESDVVVAPLPVL